MSETIKSLKEVAVLVCLIFILTCFGAAQNTPASDERSEKAAANAVAENQPIVRPVEESEEFYRFTAMVPKALANGETENAKTYAVALLKQAESFRDDWNYGNAIHTANLVLGFIALDAGEIDKAKRHLLEAGKTSGSPQLNTFGPNMLLAKELLEMKEYETVLEYFALCSVFWKSNDGRLEQWKMEVIKKEMPDFRANLLYGIGDLPKVRRTSEQN